MEVDTVYVKSCYYFQPEVLEEHRKKTDEATPDDKQDEEEKEEVGPKGDNPETAKKSKKSDLDIKEVIYTVQLLFCVINMMHVEVDCFIHQKENQD